MLSIRTLYNVKKLVWVREGGAVKQYRQAWQKTRDVCLRFLMIYSLRSLFGGIRPKFPLILFEISVLQATFLKIIVIIIITNDHFRGWHIILCLQELAFHAVCVPADPYLMQLLVCGLGM